LPEPQTKADYGELLRTIGFASAPGLIRVFGIIPVLGGIVFFVASVWMLVAMVIAVRQALDYSGTLRAVGVCAIGWVIQVVLMGLVLSFMGAFEG
jgi:ABC-type antimicrobial peptide transport system permease subunit